jgi:hypothetical protein
MLVSQLVSLLSAMPQTHEVAMVISSDHGSLYRLVNSVHIANSLSLVILEDSVLLEVLNNSKDKRRKGA